VTLDQPSDKEMPHRGGPKWVSVAHKQRCDNQVAMRALCCATRRRGGTAIGRLKVLTENGWFAARRSVMENVYRLYAESYKGSEHLRAIQADAQDIVEASFRAAPHACRAIVTPNALVCPRIKRGRIMS